MENKEIGESSSRSNLSFDPDLIHAIYKHVWARKKREAEILKATQTDGPVITRKRNRLPPGANVNALKLSCELLRQFVVEAVQRAATIAEAEGATTIAPTHLERILPQLLLDF